MPVNLRFILLLLTIGCVLSSCGEDDQIRSYTIAKEKAPIVKKNRAKDPHASVPHDPHSKGMSIYAAILPKGDQLWFVKVTGQTEVMKQEELHFFEFLNSIQFTDDSKKPLQYVAPKSWEEKKSSGMRYAAFNLDDKKTTECTIIPLKKTNNDWLVLNINRWRRQIGLAQQSKEKVLANLSEMTIAGTNAHMVLLNSTDREESHHDHDHDHSHDHDHAHDHTEHEKHSSNKPSGPFQFQKPEPWASLPVKGMRVVAFTVGQAQKQVEITVIPLGVEAGSLLDNINRWNRQIQLPAISKEALPEWASEITIDGQKSHFVDLHHKNASSSQKRIMGAILKRGSKNWFFKMMGPHEAVGSQKEHFMNFITSIKFPE